MKKLLKGLFKSKEQECNRIGIKVINCHFIQTNQPIDETEEIMKVADGTVFENCTFYIRKGRAAIHFV